jgi:septal ring factor EnvC (AmiA/AmiB activator)
MDVKEKTDEAFEDRVNKIKETIESLDDWRYDFEDKVNKIKRNLNIVEDNISLLKNN